MSFSGLLRDTWGKNAHETAADLDAARCEFDRQKTPLGASLANGIETTGLSSLIR